MVARGRAMKWDLQLWFKQLIKLSLPLIMHPRLDPQSP
ncbi:hypothetical protein MRBBS_1477 [Marinobacter sp. BSs20148]|nr:hypothetical protein MRBBS_1477 [Marinobacter sp. BSs20148]